ncbi:MAG TPA: FadR/GntR family transcriptional regulator [Bosea sp. (in: a-proteobacteria)]|jgi:DNA-binding FadR family transcriptional regulator|uniref:FadR/GntR family transcriptional regulator n=1 Tax=Bosea sp. (in: a-proteobacteria) TaxID=1871050 RepID=UPI002E1316E4|nr:FadR/GntR family transcriptional regulator [Bosea sp. (in: a-proteobacteria)]
MMDQKVVASTDAAFSGVLTQLYGFLSAARLPDDGRLPPERELAELLGVKRTELRKGLAVLEREGQLWRHVGKGTFVGPKPPQLVDISDLAQRSNPVQVMKARIGLEPELARLAAINATAAEIATLAELNAACRAATTWREYEAYDARFHHEIAEAAHNPILLALFDTLNAVRRAVTWGRPRPSQSSPPADHHSFEDHARIVDAIAHREPGGAADAVRRHLQNVEDRLIGRSP